MRDPWLLIIVPAGLLLSLIAAAVFLLVLPIALTQALLQGHFRQFVHGLWKELTQETPSKKRLHEWEQQNT